MPHLLYLSDSFCLVTSVLDPHSAIPASLKLHICQVVMDKAWFWAVSRTGPALLGQARLRHLTGWEMPLAQPTDLPTLGQAIGSRLVQEGHLWCGSPSYRYFCTKHYHI